MSDPATTRRWSSEGGFTLTEMLVSIVIMGLITTSVMATIITSHRSAQFQSGLSEVMDDGRVSLDRIRGQLREGRRVLAGSNAHHLYWWVDSNQDGIQQAIELVNFCVAPIASTTCVTSSLGAGQYQMLRYTDAAPSQVTRVAETLTDTDVFTGYSGDVKETKVVTITLPLQVVGDRGPDEIVMTANVRLRNVE